jgi:hypothetical protein
MSSAATLCAGLRLLRTGIGLMTLGLTTGLGLSLHFFYVTPFEICSAALATTSVSDVRPGALPHLATGGPAGRSLRRNVV